MQQDGWTLKTCKAENVRRNGLHFAWFHLRDVFRKGESTEMGGKSEEQKWEEELTVEEVEELLVPWKGSFLKLDFMRMVLIVQVFKATWISERYTYEGAFYSI